MPTAKASRSSLGAAPCTHSESELISFSTGDKGEQFLLARVVFLAESFP